MRRRPRTPEARQKRRCRQSRTRQLAIVATPPGHRDHRRTVQQSATAAPTIFVRLATRFFSCDKRTNQFTEQQMATLEALRAVLDDKGTPEIIRNHIIDSLQYALRNHGQIFTSKEVEWLAGWDDARIPLAATRELHKRVAETSR
jgi:hypothetical protein